VCAVVDASATSSAVLAVAGDVRTEKSLVCGVAGYPTTDCGGPVKEVSAAAKAADQPVTIAAPAATPSAAPSAAASSPAAGTDVATASSSGTSGGTVAAYVIAALVLLALVGYLLARSRSRARQGV
jgi:hypothetical protein